MGGSEAGRMVVMVEGTVGRGFYEGFGDGGWEA